MRHVKSERLKKLEIELGDLEQWLKLGLVPKKDIEKHKEEIATVRGRIDEEKERLQFLKESGEGDDYITPKRTPTRAGYTEMPTLPDVDVAETSAVGVQESTFGNENESSEFESSIIEEREEGDQTSIVEDEESYFSDRNRWRRGGIVDPDADEW